VIEATSLRAAPARHGFFTRAGGVSEGLYASLNCGVGSRDAPGRVAENRARALAALGAGPERLAAPFQVHSSTAVVAETPWRRSEAPRVDGVVTATRGLAIGVLTADCAPVLFCDPGAGVIGAAHAGWRGALSGIVEATVASMEGLGARRDRILAAIGPCIGRDAYEVGEDFRTEFLAAGADNDRFFSRPQGDARPHFDLAGFVASRLAAAGIGSVENLALCTYSGEPQFFSYRRATHRRESDYGRQISAIVLP
jgi:YfiH family protein